jgi:hypothetical protein
MRQRGPKQWYEMVRTAVVMKRKKKVKSWEVLPKSKFGKNIV